VRAAILAANANNTQPWLFKVTPSAIELYADKRRNTGAFDPYLRELYISLGCALENLLLAGEANGYKASVTLVPGKLDGIPANPGIDLVARVDLQQTERQANELHSAIPRRHTNRFPFDVQKPIPVDFIETLGGATSDQPDVRVFLFTAEAERKRVVQIIGQSVEEILHSYPEMFKANAPWFRDWHSAEKAHDGITLDDIGQPPLATALFKFLPRSMDKMLSPLTIKLSYVDLMMTGRLLGAVAVRDRYEQSQNVRAGRIWQRAHLLATAHGLAGRPANQAAELVDQERLHDKEPKTAAALATVTGDAGWQTTFMFYMGYATHQAHPTVRRSVQEVVV